MTDKKHFHDIIVIGAGSGGLNIASFMNKAGFRVLLIDKSDKSIGGDCLNFGCVPSKALIHISRLMHNQKKARKFMHSDSLSPEIDIEKVTGYIKSKQEIIRKHENAEYFRKQGIDVTLGVAKFTGKNTISVKTADGTKKYSAKKIVIATGSRPRKLDIPGVNQVKYYTNENIFEIDYMSKNMLIIGGGPIGIEIAQAFQRLGSHVCVVQSGNMFLPRETKDTAEVLLKALKKEGVKFYFDSRPKEFLSATEVILSHKKGSDTNVSFDTCFVAIGRVLNTENLGLSRAGIKMYSGKIVVDKYLRTTNKNVYLCGDIAGSYQFTHAAELHAGVLLNNFFSPFKKKVNYDNLSWVTYTDPEIATFGLGEQELKNRKIKFEKLVLGFSEDDRSIVDDSNGKLVLYIKKDKILGGSMAAPNAGELVQELILANSSRLSIKKLFNKVYAYPVASRVNKRIIANKFSEKLNETTKKLFKLLY